MISSDILITRMYYCIFPVLLLSRHMAYSITHCRKPGADPVDRCRYMFYGYPRQSPVNHVSQPTTWTWNLRLNLRDRSGNQGRVALPGQPTFS
jgi:hypothetical protein